MGFQTALSALKASSTAIDTVGNNLANLNTTGFKRSVVSFSDIMNSLGSSGNTQVGAGVGRAFTDRLFTQGLVTSTNNPLNAAVQGSGFFVVRPASAETGAASTGVNEYTRDGHFQIGSNGFLVTPFNSRVQGWNLNPQTGAIDSSGPVQDITIPLGSSLPPVVTSTLSFTANLDSSAAAGSAFSVPVEIFDALGGSHQFTLKFTKNASTANTWDLSLTTSDPTVQNPGQLTSKLSLTSLTFTNGALSASTANSINIQPIQFTTASGIPDMPAISWSLWKVPPTGNPPTGGQSGLTQFSQPSAVSSFTQNGKASATLADVRITDGGFVNARYTDGSESQIARIALADVRNPDTLVGLGDNLYRTATNTVVLPPAVPQTGAVGNIIGESLESANVDIAQEFTDLITFQRYYQANSRVVSTIDQLTQETINLKQ